MSVEKTKPIYLRVRVADPSRRFDYSFDGKRWQAAGSVMDASLLSDQGTPPCGFMGTMVGVFAVNTNPAVKIPTDFDWFHVENH